MISLGIDIGGTGCKCVAFRDNGEQVALSYREYPTKPGEVNLDALALRESVFFVISDCVRKLEDPKDVAAITVSSFGESFVPVDKDGQPLTDIILYFANTESGAFTDLVNSCASPASCPTRRTRWPRCSTRSRPRRGPCGSSCSSRATSASACPARAWRTTPLPAAASSSTCGSSAGPTS